MLTNIKWLVIYISYNYQCALVSNPFELIFLLIGLTLGGLCKLGEIAGILLTTLLTDSLLLTTSGNEGILLCLCIE